VFAVLLEDLRGMSKEIEEHYSWLAPASLSPSVGERGPRGIKSGVSDPTGRAVVEHERMRAELETCRRLVVESKRSLLGALRAVLRASGPDEPREGMRLDLAGEVLSARERERLAKLQQRRIQRGEGRA